MQIKTTVRNYEKPNRLEKLILKVSTMRENEEQRTGRSGTTDNMEGLGWWWGRAKIYKNILENSSAFPGKGEHTNALPLEIPLNFQ